MTPAVINFAKNATNLVIDYEVHNTLQYERHIHVVHVSTSKLYMYQHQTRAWHVLDTPKPYCTLRIQTLGCQKWLL